MAMRNAISLIDQFRFLRVLRVWAGQSDDPWDHERPGDQADGGGR